jgi:RimJ/RimL family protein N-acetyltransferase
MIIRGISFEIRPVAENEIVSVLAVYCQCEDFLALGPEPHASLSMVLKDLEISRREGGIFCGIYDLSGTMIGVVDFTPEGFQGNPDQAFLFLLMIVPSHRNCGVGTEVVRRIEAEIATHAQVQSILSGVQINNKAAIRFWQRNGYKIVGGPALQPDQTVTFQLQKDIR